MERNEIIKHSPSSLLADSGKKEEEEEEEEGRKRNACTMMLVSFLLLCTVRQEKKTCLTRERTEMKKKDHRTFGVQSVALVYGVSVNKSEQDGEVEASGDVCSQNVRFLLFL